jgi:hypothetical protein
VVLAGAGWRDAGTPGGESKTDVVGRRVICGPGTDAIILGEEAGTGGGCHPGKTRTPRWKNRHEYWIADWETSKREFKNLRNRR